MALPIRDLAPASPSALRADGRLAAELRAAVAPDGECDGTRFALALVGALRIAARAGRSAALLRDTADAFVRRALHDTHAAEVVDAVVARARGVVAPLARPSAERPALIDLAAMLERPPVA